MAEKLLPGVNSPEDIKKLNREQLDALARELREYIIDMVSKNGGHLAPNLGVVELTLALHKVFSSPRDKLVFDVGHQSYVHKIITGRREEFKTIRKYGGLSGFPKISESEHDAFGTGHSSTSISAALGMAVARDLAGEDYHVVAIIGDGSMTGGLSFEAVNHAGNAHKKLIVVLNDNEMSIDRNVGAMSEYLNSLRTGEIYNRLKNNLAKLMQGAGIGESVLGMIRRLKSSVKYLLVPMSVFEELGFTYLGPVDGHDIDSLVEVLEGAKKMDGPVLVHVLTKKGKGYLPAEENPAAFHGTGPFDVATGQVIRDASGVPTYTEVFSNTLCSLAGENEKIVGITAAMPDGTGLKRFSQLYPERYFDVGIAEQHAVTMAAGMAARGLRPVVAVYSSFAQRAYDNLLHDVCLQNLSVILCLDRAGLVGDDGCTHHGLFDFAYLGSMPNMVVMAPKDEGELANMLATALQLSGPVAIRYPRGRAMGVIMTEREILPVGKGEVLREGKQIVFLALGSMIPIAGEVVEMLAKDGVEAGLVNLRFAKPLDEELILQQAAQYGHLVTLEEGVLRGGVGSAVVELLNRHGCLNKTKLLSLGVGDEFVTHGRRDLLLRDLQLDGAGIYRKVTVWLKQD
ncbi:MAG: 1-deoxy-D-xylulose-5-phosphate synthase [Acidaminococcaceae bacterium]|nr:1-deoxy-D-xylulose-5-phosphate synthase [Acidaminococcaceae bacterium]